MIEEKIAPEKILNDMSKNIKDDILIFVKNQILNIKKQSKSNDLQSEPVDFQEALSELSKENYLKYSNILNTKTDIKNLIVNNPSSDFHRDNLIKKVLECLKGERIEQPRKDFFQVRDLKLEDIDMNKMELTK